MYSRPFRLHKRILYWVNLAIAVAMILSLLPFNIQLPGSIPDLGPEPASAQSQEQDAEQSLSLLAPDSPMSITAAGPAPIQTFFVPFPEDDIIEIDRVNIAGNGAVVNGIVTVVGITASQDNTVVYWDHHENGYETTINDPVQTNTLVLGDNNTANGNAATYCTTCSGDNIDKGDVLVFINNVPENTTATLFDAGDKIASSGLVAVDARRLALPCQQRRRRGHTACRRCRSLPQSKFGHRVSVAGGREWLGCVRGYTYVGYDIRRRHGCRGRSQQ